MRTPLIQSFFTQPTAGSESQSTTPGSRLHRASSKPSPFATKSSTSATTSPSPADSISRPCGGLSGPQYLEYILRTETRSLGGVGSITRSNVMRNLFPYKPFPLMKRKKNSPTKDSKAEHTSDAESESDPLSDRESESDGSDGESDVVVKHECPSNGNRMVGEAKWTTVERAKLDQHLKALARWEVEYERRAVRSTRCERMTKSASGICDSCMTVSKDESFKDAVRRVRTCSSSLNTVSLRIITHDRNPHFYRRTKKQSCPRKSSVRLRNVADAMLPLRFVESRFEPYRRSSKILFSTTSTDFWSAMRPQDVFCSCTSMDLTVNLKTRRHLRKSARCLRTLFADLLTRTIRS